MLKTEGMGSNLLNSSAIESDSFSLNSINFINSSKNINPDSANTLHSVSSTAANLLHGNRKKQLRYLCSPLSSVSMLSSLPWLSKSNNVLNNSFIQPFHSFIKYWPSSCSYSNTINNYLNKVSWTFE